MCTWFPCTWRVV
ncbi:hypothetical protein Taro_039273 [Colocasia esculenta]|uniref:Uncharacterized protein n=1 Tax=Colocasia esculenta TaxID=4460 RepID=A0A843WA94_COLES|nr:hypothetical protein [Colocasia esculenta]